MSTIDAKIEAVIGNQYPTIVVPIITAAQQTIDIIMYEWKWYTHESAGGMEKLNLAIVDACRRGVQVRVLMNIESMGHAITKINGRTATFLQQRGAVVKFGQVGVATHAKMIILDKRICVLGSHNYSKGAFTRNQEVSVLIEGGEGIRQFIDYHETLWAQY
jgi:phosphatidylserine/phosphatidylglycerophosphate/cardiolipin synthase-like enzyme